MDGRYWFWQLLEQLNICSALNLGRMSMPNGINPDEVNKAGRFIKYLQELTNLRTPTVRHVRTYEEKGKVLWLSDCPHEQGVFTQAWGRDEEHDQDEWLEVQRRQEPPLPAVPDECKDWVNHKTLRDTNDLPEKPELPNVPGQCEDWVSHKALRDTNDLPELLPEITRQIPNPNWYEDSDQPETITQTERLEDHPEVGQTGMGSLCRRSMVIVDGKT